MCFFHSLKAKQEKQKKTKQENYQKQNQHRNIKAKTYIMKIETNTTKEKKTTQNKSNLGFREGMLGTFVSNKQANIRKGKGKKKTQEANKIMFSKKG